MKIQSEFRCLDRIDMLIFGYQPAGHHVHKGEFQLTHNIETWLCRFRFQIFKIICFLNSYIYLVQDSMLCNRRLYWPALREIWELLNSHNWTLKQKCIVTNNYTRTKFLSKVFKLTKVDCSKWEEEQLAKVPFLKMFLFEHVVLKFLTEKRSFATCNILKPFA